MYSACVEIIIAAIALIIAHQWRTDYRRIRRIRARDVLDRDAWLASQFPGVPQGLQMHAWMIASIIADIVGVDAGRLRASDRVSGDYIITGHVSSLLSAVAGNETWEELTSRLTQFLIEDCGPGELTEEEVRVAEGWVTLGDIVESVLTIVGRLKSRKDDQLRWHAAQEGSK